MKAKYFKANRIRTVFITGLILCVSVWASCHKSIIAAAESKPSINISILGENNEDLLNPATEGSFNNENIEVLYLVNGELVSYNKPSINNPHGYMIDFEEGQWFLNLSPDFDQNSNSVTFYIRWNYTTTDTIVCNYTAKNNTIVCEEITYNDQQITKDKNIFSVSVHK